MPAGKVLVDTSVYIRAIRQGRTGSTAMHLIEWFPRTYLASVVSAELRAGMRSARGLREVLNFTAAFARVGRVVTPTAQSWNQAGDILARIVRTRPDLSDTVRDLWNDALIALSARQVGAIVVTETADDFALLRQVVAFGFEPLRVATR
jgi:predicted nucleic acid-binding protein